MTCQDVVAPASPPRPPTWLDMETFVTFSTKHLNVNLRGLPAHVELLESWPPFRGIATPAGWFHMSGQQSEQQACVQQPTGWCRHCVQAASAVSSSRGAHAASAEAEEVKHSRNSKFKTIRRGLQQQVGLGWREGWEMEGRRMSSLILHEFPFPELSKQSYSRHRSESAHPTGLPQRRLRTCRGK